MGIRNIPLAEAGPTVADVMLRAPRTLAPGATVADARAAFANPRERLVLVADGPRFLGTVLREQVADGPGDAGLDGLYDPGAGRVGPDEPVSRALAALDAADADRLPVVREDGTLVGLVCLNRRHGHFCADEG